jgi:hypothetical protein
VFDIGRMSRAPAASAVTSPPRVDLIAHLRVGSLVSVYLYLESFDQ